MAPLAYLPLLSFLLQFTTTQKVMLFGAFLCLAMLLLTLRATFSAPTPKSANLSRLQSYLDREENLSPIERFVEHADEEAAAAKKRRDKQADLLPTLTKFMNKSRLDFLNSLSAQLTRIQSSWRASEVIYIAVLAAMFCFCVIGVVLQKYALGAFFALGCLAAPFQYVKMKAKRWMVRFETQLADTLLLMSNATQAGYGFQQAMEMVAREGQPPMADEFAKMSQEVQLGVPIADALTHMAERVQNADFTLSVTAIQISMEVGGALSEILRSISETIRERVRIRGEIGILTAQGKMTGLMLSMLPVGMFFLLNIVGSDPTTGEKYADPLFNGQQYPLGPKMVIYGIFSQMVGYFVINRIVNIEI